MYNNYFQFISIIEDPVKYVIHILTIICHVSSKYYSCVPKFIVIQYILPCDFEGKTLKVATEMYFRDRATGC